GTAPTSTPRTLRRPCRTEPSQSSNRSPSKPSLESPRFERPSRTCYPSSRSVLLPIMPVRTAANPPPCGEGGASLRRFYLRGDVPGGGREGAHLRNPDGPPPLAVPAVWTGEMGNSRARTWVTHLVFRKEALSGRS